ncbi:MAG: oligosaccharide flippase family protein [Candidatus Gastranaerophilales bacterium]|nr:oligosaccharide flippase family protein [Candidatus Gastranaerophilales bacterium]
MQSVENINLLYEENFSKEILSDIAKDALKYVPSKVLGMLMNLAVVPIYTSLLPPGEYGLYHIAIALTSFMAIIFSDWVGFAGLRFFKQNNANADIKSYFSTLLFLITSNLALMYVLCAVFFNKLSEFFEMPSKMIIAVLLVVIPVAIRALLFQVLRAQIKPFTYTLIVVVNQFSTIGFAFYFIKYLNLGAMGIIAGMAISITIIDLLLFFATKMYKHCTYKLVDRKNLLSFYKYGCPIAVASLGMWFVSHSNKLVLQHFHGSEYNGYAGVGYNLTFSVLFPLFAILTLAAIPRIINDFEDGKDVRPTISSITAVYFILFLPIVAIMCTYSREIILFFSNEKFIKAQVFIPFLAISGFLYGLTEYTVIQYHLAKKTYIQTAIKLLPSILGLAISIVLLPIVKEQFILIVIGISTLITQVIYLGFSIFISMKKLSWKIPYKTIFMVIFATFSSIFIVKFLNIDNFVLESFIIAVFYLAALKMQGLKLKEI